MSGDPRETTGLIGARWTAGNRLELTRPNGQRDLDQTKGQWATTFVVGAVGPGEHAGTLQDPEDTRTSARRWDVPVAESVAAPPGPIPNPVVTRYSAGEYCEGNFVGGEAAAGTSQRRD